LLHFSLLPQHQLSQRSAKGLHCKREGGREGGREGRREGGKGRRGKGKREVRGVHQCVRQEGGKG
jgi:hypothetical protein